MTVIIKKLLSSAHQHASYLTPLNPLFTGTSGSATPKLWLFLEVLFQNTSFKEFVNVTF